MNTLLKHSVSKGVIIDEELYNRISTTEYLNKVRDFMINLLSRRDHARNELRDKARRKKFPLDSIELVLDELTEKKYLNNLTFAKKFTRDKFEFNKWGAKKIRVELFKKGISEKDISIALMEINDSDQQNTILELILKNKKKFHRTEPIKRKKKIFDFLLRKGYDSANILKQMPTLLSIIEE